MLLETRVGCPASQGYETHEKSTTRKFWTQTLVIFSIRNMVSYGQAATLPGSREPTDFMRPSQHLEPSGQRQDRKHEEQKLLTPSSHECLRPPLDLRDKCRFYVLNVLIGKP